ncbi:MAG: amino acid permease [Acidimicrobiales bacterium]
MSTSTGASPASEQRPSAAPLPGSFDLPETLLHRAKTRLLGKPLVTDELQTERLGKPTALAVLSSDVMSSSAYATEQILRVLVPVVGAAAFALVLPITVGILLVLTVVTLSYRQVIEAYPKAGGAYVVSRENFGLKVAQIASAALLIDYTLTVAVSVAAGVDALTSAVPQLTPYSVELSVACVLLIAYGNLRGIREAGRSFAVPTFFFILNMAVLIAVGLTREALGTLHPVAAQATGTVLSGAPGQGLLLGASLFFVLQAFANGGTALTGTEAISNGVSIFRDPRSKNARATLTWMAVILGSMFLGVSVLASLSHATPYVLGTPTVLSQIARDAYGTSALGTVLYLCLQGGTMLILVLAANTSFTGFPFLASFAAEDSFLPRQLTRRGHRLVFSNGIVILTVISVALLVATRASVASLISLYAIGVFTGFTMAGAGMVRHHLTERGEGWRRKAAINGTAAAVSLLVDLIFAITKFTEGAWVVVVLMPLMVLAFIRLNRQYRCEDAELQEGAAMACEAPVLRRHVVLVFVDRLDLATARAIQYARALAPDELRAVYFMLDSRVSERLSQGWASLGLARLPLEIRDCQDRRLSRAALELVAETLAGGETEVSVVMPRRIYQWAWSRVLHDRTADRIATVIGHLPHANATIVPFQLGLPWRPRAAPSATPRLPSRKVPQPPSRRAPQLPSRRASQLPDGRDAGGTGPRQANPPGAAPIGSLQWRQRAKVAGRVASVQVQPFGGSRVLTCTVQDGTGGITLMFTRPSVAGIGTGGRVSIEGMVGEHHGRLAMLNPQVEVLAPPSSDQVR